MNKLPSRCLALSLCGTLAQAQTIQNIPQGLEAQDWQEIHAAYDRGRHALLEVGDTHQAHNPGQRWGLAFDGRGFLEEPSGGSWSWGLELVSYGLRDDERPVERPTDACADGGHLTYVWGSTLEEWYHNDARGLEHGFTVRERPAGQAEADFGFTLRVRGALLPEVEGGGRDVRFVDAACDVQITYSGLAVVDSTECELAASFSASGAELHLRVSDQGASYPLTIDPLALQAYLKASNTGSGDGFGTAVAVWGDTVAIGASGENSAATGVNGDQASDAAPDSGAGSRHESDVLRPIAGSTRHENRRPAPH